MISPTMAKLISILPEGIVHFLARKVVNKNINKYANIKINGLENLKDIKTPTIFICNHLSNSDGLILGKVLKDFDPTFVAGIKLSNDPTTNLAIGIHKTTTIKPNTADKEGLKNIMNLIKEGENIIIFPEGTRSRTGKMIQAKKGILLISKLTKAPIVPIGLYGTEKLLPINKEGDMSSEKFNYADVNISIGKQFFMPKKESDEDKKVYEERAINEIMYSIAELIPEEYRGVYSK